MDFLKKGKKKKKENVLILKNNNKKQKNIWFKPRLKPLGLKRANPDFDRNTLLKFSTKTILYTKIL